MSKNPPSDDYDIEKLFLEADTNLYENRNFILAVSLLFKPFRLIFINKYLTLNLKI